MKLKINKKRMFSFFLLILLFCQFIILIDNVKSKDRITIEYGKTYQGSVDLPAEMDTYYFSGAAGDNIIVRMTSTDFYRQVRLYAPNGTLLADADGLAVTAEFFYILPVDGVYSILAFDSYGTGVGNYSLYLQRVSDPGSVVSLGFGKVFSGSIDRMGEVDSYIFSGVVGDSILVRMTGPEFYRQVRLFAPNGSLLADADGLAVTAEFYFVLPVSGVYSILAFDSYGTGVGNYSLYLQRINNPSSAVSLGFGKVVSASIVEMSEMDSYVFTGAINDSIIVRMTSSDFYRQVRLYAPNGSLLADADGLAVTAEFSYILPVNGVYSILAFDSYGTNIGNYSLFFQTTGTGEEIPQANNSIPIAIDIPPTEIVVISAGVVGITLLGLIAGTSLGRYKFYSFLSLFTPLYLKTVREDVFDNQKRFSMYNHIAENQPAIYSDIKKACNLSHGEINWHARMMEQLGLIKIERKGFNLFFKIAGESLPKEKFIRLTDTQKIILDLIKNKPGITQAEIVGEMKLKQQNISYNLLKLEKNNKIKIIKQGNVKQYYIQESPNV